MASYEGLLGFSEEAVDATVRDRGSLERRIREEVLPDDTGSDEESAGDGESPPPPPPPPPKPTRILLPEACPHISTPTFTTLTSSTAARLGSAVFTTQSAAPPAPHWALRRNPAQWGFPTAAWPYPPSSRPYPPPCRPVGWTGPPHYGAQIYRGPGVSSAVTWQTPQEGVAWPLDSHRAAEPSPATTEGDFTSHPAFLTLNAKMDQIINASSLSLPAPRPVNNFPNKSTKRKRALSSQGDSSSDAAPSTDSSSDRDRHKRRGRDLYRTGPRRDPIKKSHARGRRSRSRSRRRPSEERSSRRSRSPTHRERYGRDSDRDTYSSRRRSPSADRYRGHSGSERRQATSDRGRSPRRRDSPPTQRRRDDPDPPKPRNKEVLQAPREDTLVPPTPTEQSTEPAGEGRNASTTSSPRVRTPSRVRDESFSTPPRSSQNTGLGSRQARPTVPPSPRTPTLRPVTPLRSPAARSDGTPTRDEREDVPPTLEREVDANRELGCDPEHFSNEDTDLGRQHKRYLKELRNVLTAGLPLLGKEPVIKPPARAPATDRLQELRVLRDEGAASTSGAEDAIMWPKPVALNTLDSLLDADLVAHHTPSALGNFGTGHHPAPSNSFAYLWDATPEPAWSVGQDRNLTTGLDAGRSNIQYSLGAQALRDEDIAWRTVHRILGPCFLLPEIMEQAAWSEEPGADSVIKDASKLLLKSLECIGELTHWSIYRHTAAQREAFLASHKKLLDSTNVHKWMGQPMDGPLLFGQRQPELAEFLQQEKRRKQEEDDAKENRKFQRTYIASMSRGGSGQAGPSHHPAQQYANTSDHRQGSHQNTNKGRPSSQGGRSQHQGGSQNSKQPFRGQSGQGQWNNSRGGGQNRRGRGRRDHQSSTSSKTQGQSGKQAKGGQQHAPRQ